LEPWIFDDLLDVYSLETTPRIQCDADLVMGMLSGNALIYSIKGTRISKRISKKKQNTMGNKHQHIMPWVTNLQNLVPNVSKCLYAHKKEPDIRNKSG
jgi:hypothetical protein